MKKIFCRVIAALVVLALVIINGHILNYILIDDANSYSRIMEHEFYNQADINILCLGGSHCYRGIIPTVVGERIGKSVFNASSSAQSPDASYVLIKKAIELYNVEEIYLEISASMAQWVGEFNNRSVLTGTYIVSDYLRPSFDKVKLLLGASRSEFYVNSFFPARRNWGQILDFKYIDSLIQKKSTNVYRNYDYDNAKFENEWYVGNGYVANKVAIGEHQYYTTDGFNHIFIKNISEDWKETIDSIIKFCNKHNVKITLYDSPISCFQLASQGNYDEYISFVNDFIKGKNVKFAEFNLLREEYLPYKQTNYEDGHHLNMYGANDFSVFLSKYINGEIPETAYYKSISEKLEDISPDYYGIAYNDDAERNVRHIRLVSNLKDCFEFKVEVSKKDGSVELIQDYNTNNEIDISKDLLSSSNDEFNPKIIVSYRYGNNEGVEEY